MKNISRKLSDDTATDMWNIISQGVVFTRLFSDVSPTYTLWNVMCQSLWNKQPNKGRK